MRELNKEEVRELNKGDKVVIKSKLLPHVKADYIGKVVQITKKFICFEVKAIRRTLPEGQSFEDPIPYKYCIDFNDVGKSDYVFVL